MIVGTTLMKLNGDPYYTPQFNRAGLAAVFGCQVLQMVPAIGISLDIDIEHKNLEDTSFTSAATFTTITGTGTYTKLATALKEQVRLKLTVSGSNAYDGVHVLLLTPSWRPY